MGIVNRTLSDITNSIAMKINGVPADTVHRPFKSEIIQAVNESENSIILDKPQYDFLRKTATLKAWAKGTGQTVKQLQDAHGTKSAVNSPLTNQTPGAVTYIAEKYIAPAGTVLTPASLQFTIDTFASAGKLNGQFEAFITRAVTLNNLDPTQDPAEKITMPDLNNIIATATLVNVVNDLFDTSANIQFNPLPNAYVEPIVTMTFPTPAPVSNQQVYWVVIKWTSQYNNGVVSPNTNARNMQFNSYLTPVSGTSLYWTGTNYPTLASAITGGTWNIVLTLDNAVFLSKNILLPTDCNLALRIGQPYNGTMGGIFMLPVGTDAVMFKQFNVPCGTFCITGEDPTTGAQLCSLNTSVTIPTVGVPVTYPIIALAAEYYLDYISSGPTLVNDSDVPIIPVDYRDILVYKTLIDLAALNHGLFEIAEEIQQNYTYLLNKMNSKCMPQHSTAIRVNVGGFTSAMAATRDTTLSQSLLSMQWPNSWQSTFAAGQNIGQPGGY